MQITNIKFNFFPKEGITKALGQVTLDGVLTINFSLKIGQHGPFLSLGNDRKGKDGKYYASCFAAKDFYRVMVAQVNTAYQAQLNPTQPTVEVTVEVAQELTPQQKGARTRAANKAAKEAAKEAPVSEAEELINLAANAA